MVCDSPFFLGTLNGLKYLSGHPEYGCFISKDKTLTNFETGDPMSFVGPENRGETLFHVTGRRSLKTLCLLVFPWCGYLINMSDLSITIDYGRFHENCT